MVVSSHVLDVKIISKLLAHISGQVVLLNAFLVSPQLACKTSCRLRAIQRCYHATDMLHPCLIDLRYPSCHYSLLHGPRMCNGTNQQVQMKTLK